MTDRLVMRWMDFVEDDDLLHVTGLAIVGAKVVVVAVRVPIESPEPT